MCRGEMRLTLYPEEETGTWQWGSLLVNLMEWKLSVCLFNWASVSLPGTGTTGPVEPFREVSQY